MQVNDALAVKAVSQLADNGERLLTGEFNDNTIEHLHRYAFALPFCKGKDVLDIASGEGYGSSLIAGIAASVLGVDISKDAVSQARTKYRRKNLTFIEGSVSNVPLDSSAVDVVVSFETIEHHSQHAKMMAEIKRVLRAPGMLIISSPDKLNYSEVPNNKNPFHVQELYREELYSLVKEYFGNVIMLSQRLVYGSLIVPEQDSRGFTEFRGDYDEVCASESLQRPVYNVCLASDSDLPPMALSFYDGSKVLDDLRKSLAARREDNLKYFFASPSYRLGRALTWPLRKLVGR